MVLITVFLLVPLWCCYVLKRERKIIQTRVAPCHRRAPSMYVNHEQLLSNI